MVSEARGITDKELTAALDLLFAEGAAKATARERVAFDLAASP